MKSKARSLSSLHDRKPKVVLNFIIRAVDYKGWGLLYGIFSRDGRGKMRFNFGDNEGNKYASNDKISMLRTGNNSSELAG